jgi:two-component system response regulator YesN
MYRVFLVDDEPFILEGLHGIIDWREHGLEISGQASNGLDALAALEKDGADILITDITMPKMNGLELIKRLKASHSGMKFIVLSGYNEFDFVKCGISLGIENYLLKPVNIQELLSTLANTCEKLDTSKFQESIEKKDGSILRDNILYRWATNRIAPLELRERSRILQLSLEFNYYTACIARIAPEFPETVILSPTVAPYTPATLPEGAVSQEAAAPQDSDWAIRCTDIFESCCSLVGQDRSRMCFSTLDGDIGLIFGAEDQESGNAALWESLDKINSCLGHFPGLDYFITAGDFQEGFGNLHKSYANASKMQDYRLISPNCRIRYYGDSDRHGEQAGAVCKIDYAQFSKLLLSKNREAVASFIADVFAALRNNPGVTPAFVQNCCMELVFRLNRTLESLDYNITGDYGELFRSMIKMHSLEQLERLVAGIADNAVNCFITGDSKVSPVIRQVLSYIGKHYMDELSLKTLGYELNINPVYLGQLFQRETGQLFNEYVNMFKLQKAQQLLLNTNMKAIDISRLVGFTDPNYFFRLFKKYVGVSPTELRTCRNTAAVQ